MSRIQGPPSCEAIAMRYARPSDEAESPEEFGYGNIRNNLAEN